MDKAEFYNLIPENVRKPTDKEFELIRFVRDNHPCIDCEKGMEQLAQIYNTFGMRIIRDMRETAKRCEEIRNERETLTRRFKELDIEYEILESGRM